MNGRKIAGTLVAASWMAAALAANDVTLISHVPASVSTTGSGGTADDTRRRFAVARDSGDVAFTSLATDLVASEVDTNNSAPLGGLDVYYFDHLSGNITLISHVDGSASTTCTAGDSRVSPGGISADGRFVAFSSSCTDLISPALFSVPTEVVYLWDRTTNTSKIISATLPSPPFYTPFVGVNPQISEDGAFIYYAGDGNQLGFPQGYVSGGGTDPADGILYDRVADTYTLVTRPPGPFSTTANGPSDPAEQKISADGAFVLYGSNATDLVAGQVDDSNPEPNLFVYNRATATSQLVTHGFASAVTPVATSAKHYDSTSAAVLSADGQSVAYASDGSDLISGFVDHNSNSADIYFYDRVSGANELVSHRVGSAVDGTNFSTANPFLCDNGAFLVYESAGQDLIAGQVSSNHLAIFRWRASDQTNQLISHDAFFPTWDDNGDASNATMDRSGNYVAYLSTGSNGVDGFVDNDPGADALVWSASSDVTQLASHVPASLVTSDSGVDGVSLETDVLSGDVQMSGSGDFVFFPSVATNLVGGQVDSNAANDYFRYLNSPQVSFQIASQSRSEAAGVVAVNVLLSGPTTQAVTVPFSRSGTASNPADYTTSASPLVIPASATSGAINVSIVNDASAEPNETVVLTLGVPTNASLAAPSAHTLTIIDNDAPPSPPTVRFAVASESASESAGTVNITVKLSAASASAVSVPFTVSGTASSPADFSVSTASPLVIPAGATTATITVPIVNDGLDEPDETVIVTLGSPAGATLANPSVNTLTILDNDLPPTVRFVAPAESVAESAGNVSIGVTLSAPSSQPVTVQFSVGGTASVPGDATVTTSSPITIPAGATSASITVNVVDDTIQESDETVVLTLAAATNAAVGSPSTNTLTILGNDTPLPPPPTVEFATASASVDEAAGVIHVPVHLSAASSQPVSVSYAASGLATDPDDFDATPNPVVIPAGATSADIAIAIVDDPAVEGDESAVLTLGTASNAVLGSQTTFALTITDNDSAANIANFVVQQYDVKGGDGTDIVVKLDAPAATDIEVAYEVQTLPTHYAAPADYTLSGSPMVIHAGETQTVIHLSTTRGGVPEDADHGDDDDEDIINCFVLVLQPTANSAPGPRYKALVNIIATKPETLSGAFGSGSLLALLIGVALRRRPA